MTDSNEEMEKIRKHVQAVEKAISGLHSQDLAIMKMMAVESCDTQYHVYLLVQNGEELDEYAKFWRKRLEEVKIEISKANTIKDVAKVRDKFTQDIRDYVKAAKVDTADKAMEIAHSFIKKYNPVALPLKAVREGDVWIVDIDVGALAVKVAKVKVDAKTGDIISYDIPEKK